MGRCLNRVELTRVVQCLLDGTRPYEEGNRAWDELDVGEEELVGLTYFLAQILVRPALREQVLDNTISEFFELPDRMWFAVEEFGTEFIDYMLVNPRDQALELEDDLVELVTNMRRQRYEHTLRM